MGFVVGIFARLLILGGALASLIGRRQVRSERNEENESVMSRLFVGDLGYGFRHFGELRTAMLTWLGGTAAIFGGVIMLRL